MKASPAGSPFSTYVSVALAARRFDWSTSPLGSRISAKRRITRSPASPFTRSRGRPAKFWPKSNTKTPGRGSVTVRGVSVSVMRIGGAAWATSLPGGAASARASTHPDASNPGALQPGCSRRAS